MPIDTQHLNHPAEEVTRDLCDVSAEIGAWEWLTEFLHAAILAGAGSNASTRIGAVTVGQT